MTAVTRIIVRKPGGPEVLESEIGTLPAPGVGEALIRHEAIGLNFIDIYLRSGLYPLALPAGLGGEAAGVVQAVGQDVRDISVGDRVVTTGGPLGAYATAQIVPIANLIRLPDSIDFRTAAAVMVKGLTVDMLVGECGRAKPGRTVLVHAAAGGVGSLAVQWLKAIGARVIAHAGSAEKVAMAKALGADEALHCALDELPGEVRRLTDGRGAELILDGVGRATWEASLKSAAKRGLIVTYGNASGPIPPIEVRTLIAGGSLFVTRPILADYIETRERFEAAAARLFTMLESGKLSVEIGQTFKLGDVADAHRAMEGRRTTGSSVLLP